MCVGMKDQGSVDSSVAIDFIGREVGISSEALRSSGTFQCRPGCGLQCTVHFQQQSCDKLSGVFGRFGKADPLSETRMLFEREGETVERISDQFGDGWRGAWFQFEFWVPGWRQH